MRRPADRKPVATPPIVGRPFLAADGVQRRDMAQQGGVGLALLKAIGTESAGHPAGMDIADEKKRRVDAGDFTRLLRKGGTAQKPDCGCTAESRQKGATGKDAWRSHAHRIVI